MHIKCPYCKTGFDVPDGFIPPQGDMLSCPKCENDCFVLPSGLTHRAATGEGSCSAPKAEIDGRALQDVPGQPWTEPFTAMEFVWVPGGTFEMGDLFRDGFGGEKPVHTVELDGYWLGRYPVTQAQWEKVMGNNPSHFKGRNNPVEQVSWDDCQDFIRTLHMRSPASGFRLPTEAEWEYACRAGTRTSRYWGNDIDCSRANYGNGILSDECKGRNPCQTCAVGSYPPNPWGLYDMLGNVSEWCQDWYDYYYYAQSPRRNPTGPGGGSDRVYRGCSWGYDPRGVRSAYRGSFTPDLRNDSLGFRLLRTR
jgi:predicted Zn finger-like uncharacterized protein